MTRSHEITMIALCAVLACSSSERRAPAPPAPPRAADAAIEAPASLDADGHAPRDPLSEAAARAILAERFRAAGLRIRYDVPIRRAGGLELTLDGCDPRLRIGFEYIAAEERGADLTAAERAALEADPEYRILILDELAGEAELARRAEEFLRRVYPENAAR